MFIVAIKYILFYLTFKKIEYKFSSLKGFKICKINNSLINEWDVVNYKKYAGFS